MTDWGAGAYEHTAARIASAAGVAVDALAPERGEDVLDVGCGTGNAALLAAAAGARVTGVDPAARLLEVATERAAAEGVRARFVEGGAEALPLGDASFDAAISVVDRENPYRMAQVRGRVVDTRTGEAGLAVMDRLSIEHTGKPFPMRSGTLFLVEVERVQDMTLPFEDAPTRA